MKDHVLSSKLNKSGNSIYLKVIESKADLEGLIIPIVAEERHEFYFGKANVLNFLNQSIYKNDFDFPDEDNIESRHFKIKYNQNKSSFKLKRIDQSEIYLKLKDKIVLIFIIDSL